MTEQDRKEFEAWAKSMRLNVKRSPYDGSFWTREAKYAYLAWLAARRTQDADVRELVAAVLRVKGSGLRCTKMGDLPKVQEMYALAAQLKEQDDAAKD